MLTYKINNRYRNKRIWFSKESFFGDLDSSRSGSTEFRVGHIQTNPSVHAHMRVPQANARTRLSITHYHFTANRQQQNKYFKHVWSFIFYRYV